MLDVFTDYSPLIRTWQILPEIHVSRPSAFCVFYQTVAGKHGDLVVLGTGFGEIAGISSGT